MELSERGEECNISIAPFIQILSVTTVLPNCISHPNSCLGGGNGPFPVTHAAQATTNYWRHHRTYAFFTMPGIGEIANTTRHRDTLGGQNTAVSAFRSQHEILEPGGRGRALHSNPISGGVLFQ